jgi:hypothetical protein
LHEYRGFGLRHDRGGYTAGAALGQKARRFCFIPRLRGSMSRLLVIVIAVVILLVGGLFFLAGRDTEKQPVRVEKVVPLENLTN